MKTVCLVAAAVVASAGVTATAAFLPGEGTHFLRLSAHQADEGTPPNLIGFHRQDEGTPPVLIAFHREDEGTPRNMIG